MNENEIYRILLSLQSNSNPLLVSMHESVEPSPTSLLQKITNKMRLHEKLKYPHPPYDYQNVRVVTDSGEMTASYIKYDGTPLGAKELDEMREQTLVLRKLSILAGILNALQFSQTFLTPDPRQRAVIETRLNKLFQDADKRSATPEKDEVDSFIQKVIHEIEDVTGNSEAEVVRQIRNSERYFVAEYKSNNILVNEMDYDGSKLIQMDMPFKNALTDAQQREFFSIHNTNVLTRPEWFRSLPDWEQEWYFKRVPKTLEEDWSEFFKVFKSSAMTHIPGINNARMNYLLKTDNNGNPALLAHSLKIGTMVPYEMPKRMRTEETERTAQQVLDHLHREVNSDFASVWIDIDFPPNIKPIIFIGGLLSDTVGGGLDSHLMEEQSRAVNNMKTDPKYNGTEIISGNDPLNILRHFTPESGLLSEFVGRWKHTSQVMNSAKTMIDFLEVKKKEGTLSSPQISRLALMQEAYQQLHHLRNDMRFPRFDRNFAAFKSAYTSILIESMGGIVSTNCKSGKDRTGLEELYRHAMLVYYDKHKKLPSYDESSKEHEKFINIFVSLYNSLKIQEAAAANTPGSFGIKDTARVLCRDIVSKLGLIYKSFNEFANYNKPPSYRADEQLQEKEISKFDGVSVHSSPLYEIKIESRDQVVALLAERRLHIIDVMSQLQTYVGKPSPENKSRALALYDALDRMNKKIQQLEATLDQHDGSSLKEFIADLDKKYKDAVNNYSRNSVSKFFTVAQGKTSHYDTILRNAKKSPANDPFMGTPKPKIIK